MILKSISIFLIILITNLVLCEEDDDWTTDPTYVYCPSDFRYDASINSTGHVYSPRYGETNYPGPIACRYYISAPKGYRIKVTFKDIDIDPSDDCNQDKLGFYTEDGSETLGIFCGSDIPKPFFSKEGDTGLHLAFDADYMGSGRGFHVFYEASPHIEECPSGHIACKNRNCVPQNKKCDGTDDCEDGTDEENCGKPVITAAECGTTPIKPKTIHGSPDRVVGGEPAIPHSWPWQVSIQRIFVEPCGHFCGGTLINSQWVLSAAHCFKFHPEPSYHRIHIGSHHKYKKDAGEQIRYPVKIIGYPDLEMDRLLGHFGVQDDIALVKLNTPVEFTNTVQPACLPSLGWDLPEGSECYSTGWGETRGSGFSKVLKQATQTVLSVKNCPHDPRHQICTNHPQSFNSPCHGDSGGPLACSFGGKWFVVGDTSYATHSNLMSGLCAMPENKVIFSKVSAKADWIRVVVEKFS